MNLAWVQLLLLLGQVLGEVLSDRALPAASEEAPPSDTFYIRHGRSKVRHSNEKEQLLRGLKARGGIGGAGGNATALHEDPLEGDGSTAITGRREAISGGRVSNGYLFGSDYWLQSDANGSIVLATPTLATTPTQALNAATSAAPPPVTHKIRKLHMKQLVENRRNSVTRALGRGMVHATKNHRSLAEAEHLQGRPQDVAELSKEGEGDAAADDSSELAQVLQLADELGSDVNDKDEDNELDDDVGLDGLAASEEGEPYLSTTPASSVTATRNQDDVLQATFPPSDDNDSKEEALTEEMTTERWLHYAKSRNRTSTVLRPIKPPQPHWVLNKRPPAIDLEAERNALILGDSDESSALLESLESNHTEETASEPTIAESTTAAGDALFSIEWRSLGPSQAASTSVGGIALDRQQSSDLEEINFDDVGLDDLNSEGAMDDGLIDNRRANGFPLNAADGSAEPGGGGSAAGDDDIFETNPFLAGVVDAANEDEIYDWDEISRSNRRNLMRGRDVVTKFLQIVETQHVLGSNCEAGTSLNLGEGVVDRYAQDRFRVEAEVAVNRANMLTRIFKMTAPAVQADVNLLHASVLAMVEFDDDIFAAGNCFDWNEHPAQPGLFCPFAYRLPPPHLGAVFAKDLATEYHYLGNTSEWFFQARKNAEKVIARNEQYLKAFHLYSNKTEERIEDDTLAVRYEDGRWSKPYYDCGGGNIWMLTYTVPFFGYENATYHFKGTSGIDIDLRRVDIDQCPQRNTPGTTQPLNIFAGTDKCKQRTTMCEALKGLGFRRGSYKCVCRKGYYFPDTLSTQKFFNGSLLEEEYEKLMLGKNSTYNIINEYECLPCAEGCDSCEDGSPCIAALNWPMRTSILVLACTVIGLLPPAAWFTFRYQQVKVVRAASPALLRVIALGAFFIYCTNIMMYPNPNLYTCTARIWLREIGFSLTYGALMLKTWRISVIFRVRSAKAVKITDAALLKRLGIICGVIGTCLLVRTLVSPPDVVVGRTADDLKAFLCKTDYWDYTFTSMEVLFLAWGVRLCIMVRKAPSEFNESRFISMAIYNEFLLTCFLNVSMLFLQSPANPDLLYIIFFCHTQLTVTLLLGLIFGSKVYIVLRSGKSHQESIGMGGKSSGAKFNFRPQVRTFANPSSITTSTAPIAGTTSAEKQLSDQEALEEIRQLSMQLQRIQEMAPPKGVAVMTISSLLDGLKTPGGVMVVAAAAAQVTTTGNQLSVRQLNSEMQKYNQQLHVPPNNNVASGTPRPGATTSLVTVAASQPMPLPAPSPAAPPTATAAERVEKAINTLVSGDDSFRRQLTRRGEIGAGGGHIVCSQCLEASKEHYYHCRPISPSSPPPPTACEQLGSPQPEGSISFANIKLDCMCSQPELDVEDAPPPRRKTVRSAATNTPPPSVGSRRRSKVATAATGNVSYQICDKCKIKYCSSKSKSSKKTRTRSLVVDEPTSAAKSTSAAVAGDDSGLGQTRSNDLLDRIVPAAEAASKKVHSSADITFYTATTTTTNSSTTSEDENEASSDASHPHAVAQHVARVEHEEQPVASATIANAGECVPAIVADAAQSAGDISSHSNNSTSAVADTLQSTSAAGANATADASNGKASNGPGAGGRLKRPDKLMLDLNDRSKYTKEVSV